MSQQFKTLIIDDEPAARRLMKSLLQDYPENVTIIGEASNGAEAVKLIDSLKPDVIFLDIQMPDFTGFEVLEKVQHKPSVIFTTAYEQYALKAFENFSVDYLLKPIKEERLAISIQKLNKFGRLNQDVNLGELQDLIRQLKTPPKATALPIRTGDRITLVRFEQISYLEAEDKYVYVHTIEGQKYLTDQSLAALIEKLPDQYFRIQKSYIINKDRIREMHRHFNGRYLFVMDDKAGTRLTSGRTYYDDIKSTFNLG